MELLAEAHREHMDGNLESFLKSLNEQDFAQLLMEAKSVGDTIILVDNFREHHTTFRYILHRQIGVN